MKKKLNKNRKARYSKRRRLLLCLLPLLICLVVGVTNYALTFPAITMEGEYLCEKEAHAHGVSCYAKDENGELVLVCDKEEHIHDEKCLIPEPEPERYICGHRYEHEHEDGCYRDGVLVCTLEEHTHTPSCLADEYRYVMTARSLPVEATESEEEVSGEAENTPEENGALTVAVAGLTQEQGASDESADPQAEPDEKNAVATEPDEKDAVAADEKAEQMPTEQADKAEPDEAGAEAAPDDSDAAIDGETATRGLTLDRSAPVEGDSTEAAGVPNADSRAVTEQTISLNEMAATPPFTTVINFTVTKDGTEYSIDNMSGDGYDFSLVINSSRIQGSDNNLCRIYTYDPDPRYKGCVLKYDGIELTQYCASMPLDNANPKHEAGWASLKNNSGSTVVWMKVTSTGDGMDRQYHFSFIGTAGISEIKLSGALSRGGANTDAKVQKSVDWNPLTRSRCYNVYCDIPHFVDDYSQYYYISDLSEARETASSSPVPYSGFVANADNDAAAFTVTLTDTVTGESFTVLPMNQAKNDLNCQFGYLLVPESSGNRGNLYLFNRSNHTDHGVDLYLNTYTGWCLCWQQKNDMKLSVSYNDIAGKPYLQYESNTNTAYIQGVTVRSDGTHGPVNAPPSTTGEMQRLLNKTFDQNNNTFTIVLNHEHLDFGSDPLTIDDSMTNGKVESLDNITVTRISKEGSAEVMSQGYSITKNDDLISSFSLTISNPGSYEYQITFPVKPIRENDSSVSNSVSLGFSGGDPSEIIWTENSTFGQSAASVYKFSITLNKWYEDGVPPYVNGVPPKGAEFTLYETFSPDGVGDTETAVSRTDENSRSEYMIGVPDALLTVPYPGSDGLDHIVFENMVMFRDSIYYIEETEPADSTYMLEEKKDRPRYYFCFTTDNDLIEYYRNIGFSGATNASGRSPQEVIILNNWDVTGNTATQDYTIREVMKNYKYHYDLPETGSSGTLLLRAVGGGLILAAGALLIARKRASTR